MKTMHLQNPFRAAWILFFLAGGLAACSSREEPSPEKKIRPVLRTESATNLEQSGSNLATVGTVPIISWTR